MWTAIGLGLLKTIPAIVRLVENHSKEEGVKPSSNQKLDLAMNMAILILNETMPGTGLNDRQRAAIIGAINANVELANAFKED